MPRPLQIASEWGILLLGISLMATHLTFCNAQTCTWTDTSDQAGQQSAAASFTLKAGIAACKGACLVASQCMAINYYTNLRCELFNSLPTINPGTGVTFSVYSCATTTTAAATATAAATTTAAAPACTMSRSADFKGSSAAEISSGLGTSLSQCEGVCKTVLQCTAYSYGSSTCKLYESDTAVSASTGSQYASKGLCNDGKTRCCFTNFADKTAGGETVSLTSTMASCEDLCMTLSSCKAVTFSSGTCSLHTSPGKTSDVHSSYSEKSCSSGATDGSNTLTKTCQGADRANISVSSLLVVAAFCWTVFTL